MVRAIECAETNSLRLWCWFTVFTAACAAAMLMAVTAHAEVSADANERQMLAGHIPQAVAGSRPISRLPHATRINLAIGLPLRNQDALTSLLAEISDPSSPNFKHYLTPTQFAAEFGPSEQDYQALIQFAQESGLVVTGTHPNRVLLDVTGDVAMIEKTFNIKILSYAHPVRGEFYAPDREPSMNIGLKVLDISGLDNFNPPHPMDITKVAVSEAKAYVTGTGPGGYFIGKDFRAAYAPNVTLTGSGQVVGLLEFDGFYTGDVQKNAAQAGLPAVPTQTVLVNGFNGAPGSSNTEVILDIMMASYMAPGLTKLMVYEGSNPNDILNRMATDNLAQQISCSWGFGPINATTEQIFKQFIAQGQSFLQASGDSGAYKNGVMQPSDDPNLTVVGGTSLKTAGAGGPWQSESTWSGSGGGVSTTYAIPSYQQGVSMAANGGSTRMRNIPDVALTADMQMFLIQNNGQAVAVGGTSAAAPLWAGFVALANQQAAANAKPRVGFLNPLVYAIGSSSKYGSDFNDILSGGNNGFSAATGYDLATGWGSPSGQHLIYDLTETSGAPSFVISTSPAIISIKPASTGIATITATPVNGFHSGISFGVAGLPTGVTAALGQAKWSATGVSTNTVTLTASATASAGSYPLTITGVSGGLSSATTMVLSIIVPNFSLSASTARVTVPQSKSGTSTIGVSGQNGFSGSVALTVTALPAGVTVAFSPASTSATSIMTFNANGTATPGTYNVTVTGTSGALKGTTTIGLTVTAPTFSVSFAPGSVALSRGSTAAGVVTITPQNGFKGNVSFAAVGLPPGITAAFGALSPIGTSQVTFTASSTATLGGFPVRVLGASGSVKSSANLTLTVLSASTGLGRVNLSSVYNVNALVTDGAPFAGGGLDGGLNGSSTAYSAKLIGVQQSIAGTMFYFGPANVPDAVSARTISLPSGHYSKLTMLATGVNGTQLLQTFRVRYTNGTVSTFTQNLSDWFGPQNFSGETKAMAMAYRINEKGQRDNRTFYLYEYTFTLTSSKAVASITLPNNRNVVVLAASLIGSTASTRLSLPRNMGP